MQGTDWGKSHWGMFCIVSARWPSLVLLMNSAVRQAHVGKGVTVPLLTNYWNAWRVLKNWFLNPEAQMWSPHCPSVFQHVNRLFCTICYLIQHSDRKGVKCQKEECCGVKGVRDTSIIIIINSIAFISHLSSKNLGAAYMVPPSPSIL